MKDAKPKKIGEQLGKNSNEHWEMQYHCPEGQNDLPYASFLPMPGAKRAQPHQKINECDH